MPLNLNYIDMTKKESLKKVCRGVKHVLHMKYTKYIITLAIGILIVGFLGDNSVVAHLRNKHRISELKHEVAINIATTKANQEQVYMLQTDPKAVERVGRERYFMRADDEDVFVLSDDAPITEISTENETVE